jgi:DNA-binding response OmpR family regulator
MNRSVKFLRWPAEESIRSRYKREGTPCLLIVDPGASPPVCGDLSEDWIRSPASRQDVEARVKTMLRRIDVHQIPVIDAAGLVHFDNKSVNISKTQTELMKRLVAHFGDVVYRDELEQDLAKCAQAPTRNSLDLHMMRLRRRISALNLCVRTVWGRGYVLEPQLG